MNEIERNKRLLLLLQELIRSKDYDTIELLKTMVLKDTESMQKSYQIMTETLPENRCHIKE